MIRGILIIFGVLVGLLAAIAAVVALGMHRISVAQSEADAQWHAADGATSQPADADPADTEPATQPDDEAASIELWAKDAILHGDVKLVEHGSGKVRMDVARNDRSTKRAKMLAEMSSRPVTARLINFHTENDSAQWPVQITKAGDYEIDAAYACPKWSQNGRFLIKIADKTFPLTPESTRSENNFHLVTIGKLSLKPGSFSLVVSPEMRSGERVLFNLRSVQLIPAS